ncbi:MAG: hypothetical protein IKF90_17650 [Parasporobacterium sp.]|nr:hypothetical protein [Parasporobacterium sp.]
MEQSAEQIANIVGIKAPSLYKHYKSGLLVRYLSTDEIRNLHASWRCYCRQIEKIVY